MKIDSGYAILDVLAGTVQNVNKALEGGPIEICIYGKITRAYGRHDGTSKEFSVKVDKVVVNG